MSRLVCFMDKETGQAGTCAMESRGELEINCNKCDFKKKFEGEERDYFIYTRLTGELK